ncbi:MAG: DUF72 domain-containing protein [Dehalococcoidia bacterium]|nr:MAG: DUF72 domain-containing protein [Dehalococcoidia bacterium]
MFYCGTSGFSYDDWAGIYYPSHLPRKNWFSFYAQEFNSIELNFTYYKLPDVSTLKSLAAKTGGGFLFVVKANQEMTHKRQPDAGIFEVFTRSLQPLASEGKLGCVLAQFPFSFNQSSSNLEYLGQFHDWMHGIELVVEFRNSSWLNPEIMDWMRDRRIGFCCVDEPQLPRLLPPAAEVTSHVGYIRFHGRNEAKWWKHEYAWERYDYTYKPGELEEWIPRIAQISKSADRTFIFANNHWKSQAVDTIRQVRSMLDQLVL